MILLATGGSGFLGSYLIPRLAPYFETIYLLYRSGSYERYACVYQKFKNIVLVEGDLMHPDLFEDPAVRSQVESVVTHVLHAGALYDMSARRTDNYFNNVLGTQNVLSFMRRARKLEHFHYISTIAVAGDFAGRFSEDELDVGQKFKNSYAQTKYLAEMMVRSEALEKCPQCTIYRLGILVGDSKKGEISKIDGPYYLMEFLEKNSVATLALKSWALLPFPFSKKAQIPLIPVDLSAQFIETAMIARHKRRLSCYHVISEEIPKAQEVLIDILKLYGIHSKTIAIPENPLLAKMAKVAGIPESVVPYFYFKTKYDQSALFRDFKSVKLGRYQDYKDVIFSRKVFKWRES